MLKNAGAIMQLESKTAEGVATPTAAMILDKQELSKTYPNAEANAICLDLDNALWLCRLASENPMLRDLRPVVTKRWSELLALQNVMGGRHV
jgi:hypothetical protein